MQCKFYCLLIAVSVWFRCCYADTRRKSVNSESPFIAVATNAFGDQSTPKKPESKPEFTYFKDLSDCPLCNASKRQTLQSAVESFWRNELFDAFACACTYLQTKPDDGHAVSIIQAITQGKPPFIALEAKLNPLQRPAPPLRKWEVLGPINVGKLEHDADSTFMKEHVFPSYSKDALDVGSYILGMPSNATALSELATGGAVKWSTFNGNEAGEVGVGFPAVRWNDLVQGLSTTAVYEFQAWARISTFVKAHGAYLITCSGTHTVYVRNDNLTRVLVADVYRSGRVAASVDLRAGLVGLALPLRGVAQTSFQCSVEPAGEETAISVQPPQHVPDVLEFAELPGRGYLLSSVFTLPVHNLQGTALTVEFTAAKPLGQDGDFYVREAKPLQDRSHGTVEYGYPGEIAIAPGQTLYLALELIPHYASNATMPFLSCRKNKQFLVTVVPSRGSSVTVPLDFACRRVEQSFRVSYLDHDHSVSQAAVVFPLEYHSPHLSTAATADATKNDAVNAGSSKDGVSIESTRDFPVLLTMHGSGIAASNHADAHKVMLPGQTEYTFGVEGFIVVAPSRFGAHNWEHTGELSAMQAVRSLRLVLRNTVEVLKLTPKAAKRSVTRTTSLPLPQVRLGSAIASGHSMGAHGAWMVALNHPDQFFCLAPLSGWINKEEYGTANAFFHLDGSSAFVDPQLRGLLQSAMSDTHADKLMRNVQGMDVYLRVGSGDATTHPWYTRRMHRLLLQLGVNSTYAEIPDKQHWWWDTDHANDGGVLNDPAMRAFYAHCRTRAARSADKSAAVEATGTLSSEVEPPVCKRSSVQMSVVNPATHSGLCGLHVTQQARMMTRTTVQLTCTSTSTPGAARRTCTLTTSNVQKLRLRLGEDGFALSGEEVLHVKGSTFDLALVTAAHNPLDLCWETTSSSSPVLCSTLPALTSPIHQKSLVNYGPARQVSARPFCVVYGTPKSQALRLALRDLAVYIANAHAAAYGTHVRVMSDLDYIASKQATHPVLANIVFIGGPSSNRLMSMICGHNSSSIAANSTANTLPLACRLPETMDFSNSGFSLDGAVYSEAEQLVAFTLPFYRLDSSDLGTFASFGSGTRAAAITLPSVHQAVGMALCLHGNSLQAYLHLSRLAWPVVPPMVRAPLETYIPDYMVLSGELWSHGMGAVLKAGYWDNYWRPERGQSYTNMFL